ncbi:MAG: AmmeMemoRadiSam system protein B [Anaerolineales bacterium]|nr:AmmeMemoRadiSam system protein B [Anaerolineales bacterium]
MNIRPSPIAGRWYPGRPLRLRETISRYIETADQDMVSGKVWGVLAPHAGFVYSGPVAAYAFACVASLQPELVVVLSPYHHVHSAPLLTTAHEAYETPLGVVPVAADVVRKLDEVLQVQAGMGLTAVRRDPEHAIEIELPFLQVLLGDFKLVPVMLRDQRMETARALGMALADCVVGRNVLFVASSDLSHFYTQAEAAVFDKTVLQRVAAFDPAGVIRAEAEGVGFACGRGAIAAMLWATQKLGANRVQLLHYATSGDVSGDMASVVGYGAAVVVE